MKRSTNTRKKKFAQAGVDLQALISEYQKKGGTSEVLIADLKQLHETYKEGVYKAAIEGTVTYNTGN